MHTALYFAKLEESKVQCLLCPHNCVLKPDKAGICMVRRNISGILVSENYGKLSALHLDPIEKKPLYHFFPRNKIFSIGSVGCNLQCNFCQNCDISQVGVSGYPWLKDYTAEELVNKAADINDNIGIAFTYNEPTVFFEFMLDAAILSKQKGLKNVVVSNGFINETPLNELLSWIDAFNIDLKAFTDDFYKIQTHSQLDPIKQTLKIIRNSGKHLELTNLVIPGLNSDETTFDSMVNWIVHELGKDTILHISRYFPKYKSQIPVTSEKILLRLFGIAKEKLKNVYLGNI